MIKPLFRTTMLASILFFLLVYMGMKYHWVGAFNSDHNKQQSIASVSIGEKSNSSVFLSPPSTEILKAEPLTEFISDVDTDTNTDTEKGDDEAGNIVNVDNIDTKGINSSENTFLPEILENTEATSLIDAMTKDQIALHCQNLYYGSLRMVDDPNAELLVGNCVVSNFQEVFQESYKTQQILQQEQQLKIKAVQACRTDYQMRNDGFSNIEKELLIGICVSNKTGI